MDMNKYNAFIRADRAGQRAYKTGRHAEHDGEQMRAYAAKKFATADEVKAYMGGYYAAERKAWYAAGGGPEWSGFDSQEMDDNT